MRTRLFRSTDGEVFREQIVDEPGQADIRHPRWNPDTGQWEADEGRLSEYLFLGRGGT